jgi:preprotein translocase SecE subunit
MSEKKKSASQSETEEPKAQVREKEQKSARASAREERQSKPASKSARRDTGRSTTASSRKAGGFRNWALVRFVREAYRELRYKVTWPTFIEARNMTLVVILLSTVVGLILGLLDQGLLQAFKAITGK